MSNTIKDIKEIRAELDTRMAKLRSVSKSVIQGTLMDLFADNPSIQDISWAVKTSEYNDEGMHPGIAGPVINQGSLESQDEDHSWWDWMYHKNSPEVKVLEDLLNTIGEEILCEIFGDEYIIVATRTEGDDFKLQNAYCGY